MAHPAIDALDRALGPVGSTQGVGADVELIRTVGSGDNIAPSSVTVRAKVNMEQGEQFTPGVVEAKMTLIISPTQILTKQWPGGHAHGPNAPYNAPEWLPRERDRVIVMGKERSVSFVKPFPVGNEIVRIELTVVG